MKNWIFSFLMLLTLPFTAGAQNLDFDFNEMDCGPEQTTFRLFASAKAKRVVVRIYKDGTGGKPMKTVKMKIAATGVGGEADGAIWEAVVKGNLLGRFYTFDTGHGECPGVFAKAVGVNGQRAAIINMVNTFPDDWCCDQHPVIKDPTDLVVYELHHRDFSVARKDAQHPGKFLALTEPWAIDHLKKLGVNAVHILPSFDYASVDETKLDTPQYNWGYDPLNYNVPEGSYSTDPYDPAKRITEFKQMVQALHLAGIAVILDVVYNHTFSIEGSNFQKTYPDYYYRVGSNGSGCGNETASEKPMMRKFMIESVKHWVNEYRVDGFRFDLMGCHDIETMNAIREALDKIDPSIVMYGEGWSAGKCGLPDEQLGMKANLQQMPRIAAFSDELRDGLRGPFSDDTKGAFLAGLSGEEESIKYGIVGAIEHPQVDMTKVNYSKRPFALQPSQMIAYVSCHDDMCLTDRLRASVPGISEEELMRTKQGVHNSFESPDSINRIDWQNAERYPQVLKYYQDLIALRRHHPAFRLGDADLVRKHLEFLPSPKGTVAFRLKNYAGRDDWRNIIVILNGSREAQTVALPKGMYTVVCKDGEINEDSTGKIFGRRTTVSPQSALILHD